MNFHARQENWVKTRISIGVVFLALVSAAFGSPAEGLPFIHDDFPKALAEAKQQKLPVFVECWAPW